MWVSILPTRPRACPPAARGVPHSSGRTHLAFLYEGLSSAPHPPRTVGVPRECKGTLPTAQTQCWPPAGPPALPRCSGARAQAWPHPQLSCTLHAYQCLTRGSSLALGWAEGKATARWMLVARPFCDKGRVPGQALGLVLSLSRGLCCSPLRPQFPLCEVALVSSGDQRPALLSPQATELPGGSQW